jgi:hypothetical protein
MTPDQLEAHVRRAIYDPTGLDPSPPWPSHPRPRQWRRSLLWLAAAVAFVGLTLLVTANG